MASRPDANSPQISNKHRNTRRLQRPGFAATIRDEPPAAAASGTVDRTGANDMTCPECDRFKLNPDGNILMTPGTPGVVGKGPTVVAGPAIAGQLAGRSCRVRATVVLDDQS